MPLPAAVAVAETGRLEGDEPLSSELPPPFRPLPIRVLNGAGRGLSRLGLEAIRLDPEALLEAVSRKQALEDYGPASFREGYERLVASLEADAKLHAFGRYFARRQLVELLGHRLQLVEHRKRNPAVAQERVERPLFVIGLPRTGTTLLYGLLAQDPAHRSPLTWEVDDPCPPAEALGYESNPRIERCEKRMEQLRQLAPGFQSIHPIGARMPQECLVMTASEFRSLRFEMCFDVAGYQEWSAVADMAPAYSWHRRFLQHLQSRHRRERWVLKSPGHLGPIDALLAEYPDALIVQTHRDPEKVVPSVSSLEYTMRSVATDAQDPSRLGEQQLRLWSRLLHQGMHARERLPQHAHQFVDLRFGEILADPIGCVANIYDHFGLALGADAEARMRRYLEQNPRDAHGTHRYSLRMFGLEPERVRSAFKGYCERYGVESEASDLG